MSIDEFSEFIEKNVPEVKRGEILTSALYHFIASHKGIYLQISISLTKL